MLIILPLKNRPAKTCIAIIQDGLIQADANRVIGVIVINLLYLYKVHQMQKSTSMILGMLLLATGVAAQASVVYDNGAPNQQSGNEMTNWIQAEDFTLPTTTTITDVHFWSLEGTFNNEIDYAFYSDNAGSPSLVPLTVFAAGTNLVRTCGAAGAVLGFTECENSFEVTPFIASGGVTYWLGLHNGPLADDKRVEFYWETTNLNGTATGHQDVIPPANDGWDDNGQEHAFNLTAGNHAPEPETLMLLGVGLAGLGFSRRRQKN